MKRLNKVHEDRYARIVRDLTDAREGVEKAIDEFNIAMGEAWIDVAEAKEKYDEELKAAESFREEMASDMQNFYDDRSEKWQEGDAGSQYQQWMDVWGEELDELELEQPYTLDVPDFDETFESLPLSAEEA